MLRRIVLLAALALIWLPAAAAQSNIVQYVISTIAGTYSIGDDGPASSALLNYPSSAAYDKSGNLYVADSANYRIRKVTPGGVISTFAGTGNFGNRGDGGPAAQADIGEVSAIAFDNSENLLMADRTFGVIRKITPAGVISTIAGTGDYDFAGDGGSALSAAFRTIAALAVDAAGNIYIADRFNHRVRQIDTSGKITTIAGSGGEGDSGDGGPATNARFFEPAGLVIDKGGALLVADWWAGRVRKVNNGIITAYAGTGNWGFSGDGGAATSARMLEPSGMACDAAGNVFIADGRRIRKVAPNGIISTVAGTGVYSFGGDGGDPLLASLADPIGLTLNSKNELLIVDTDNHRLRLIDSSNVVNTIAGKTHLQGDGGPATSAVLFYPRGLARDPNGNFYVADMMNHAIRKVTPAGTISTVAGTGTAGYQGDGGKATAARLRAPYGVTFDADGKMYIADWGNNRIRVVSTSGDIVTVAGNGNWRFNGDGGAKLSAVDPGGVAVDRGGNIYVADTWNHRIRKVNPDGIISTVAGTGEAGYSADGVLATAAKLNLPRSITFDKAGNLLVADSGNFRIRKISTAGAISTVAGTGECCFAGDGGPAASARIDPSSVAVDTAGNIYVASPTRIRRINTAGVITTIAGRGEFGFKGDGGLGTEALLDAPTGMAIDDAGNVYFTDRRNHRIRKLAVNTPVRLQIVSGNDQKGPVETSLPAPLTVRVMGTAEVGMVGLVVNFAVTEGSAVLSANSTITDPTGLAAVSVTLGRNVGAVVVTATITGLAPVKFTLTATAAEVIPPAIREGGIASAGGSVPPVNQLAPLGLARILGTQFAPPGTDRRVTPADLVNGRLPQNFAGICVAVGSEMAPLLRVASGQIDFQMPGLGAPADVSIQVVVNCGKSDEVRSRPQTVSVQPASPEFFYFVQKADGRNPIQAVNLATGANVGAPGLIPGQSFTPAAPGDKVSLFATGFGITDPGFAAGELPDRAAPAVLPAAVMLGDRQLGESEILYAGVVPGSAGLYRIDISIPEDVSEGDLNVTVRVGDFSSPAGGYLTIQRGDAVSQPVQVQ